MRKEHRVIAAPVDVEHWELQEKKMQKGSVLDICRVCEQSVWLSPEGHTFVYETAPDDTEVVCIDCHIRLEIERRKDGDADPVPTAPVPGIKLPQGYVARGVSGLDQYFETRIREGMEE